MKSSRLAISLVVAVIGFVTVVSLTARKNNAIGSSQERSEQSLSDERAKRAAEDNEPRGPEPTAPVQRFGVVWTDKLTRSGMPEDDEGWTWLRKQGVNTIVNFRERNDVDYKKYGFESFLWLPLNGGRLPSDQEVENFLRFIQDPDNQPVHLQCSEGKDRTGMMSALTRYAIDGWSMDQALEESRRYRRGEQLAEERVNWLRQWASKHEPGSFKRK